MINETHQLDFDGQAPRYPAVKWLLGLNIAVFLIQVALVDPERVYALLGLSPENFPGAWWTTVTYMFVHAGLLHLAVNMVTLWMFGSRLESAWDTKSFVYFYLWCGIGGAIAHLLFAREASLVGASAAVSGVLLAYGLKWPEDRVYLFGFIPTKSRWLVVWMIAINIAIGLSPQTLIGWKAHLGGLAFAWLFLHAGSFGASGVRRWMTAIPDEPEGMPRAVPRARVNGQERSDGMDALLGDVGASSMAAGEVPPVADEKRRRADRLDRVLDKISTDGFESLTREERAVLEESSRKLRRGDNQSRS